MRQPLRADVRLGLADVAATVGSRTPADAAAFTVTGVATDSRDVRPGDLFVALRGETDGHQFVPAATAAGAVALLVSDPEAAFGPVPFLVVPDTLVALHDLARAWRRRLGLPLVAVTGSNGKTTTKEMLAAALGAHLGDRRRVLATAGNFNNFIGVPLTLLSGAPDHALGVVELGMSAPGEIDSLAGICEPQVGLITNAAEAHLLRFGSVDGVARAKAELWARLGAAATAVVPVDDPRLSALARALHAGPTVGFGASPEADVRLLAATDDAQGSAVTLGVDGRTLTGRLPLSGRHHALNATGAVAAARALGVDPAVALAGLATLTLPPHRARWVTVAGVDLLDDCYNANPASVRAGAAVVARRPGAGRAGAIVGDMLELGEAGPALHRQVGAALVAEGLTVVLGVGPLCAHLCQGAREAGATAVAHVPDAAAAAARVTTLFRPGDRVLLKGSRGMGLEAVLAAWPGARED
jgi:UDP-N-acetylmuramoyl-tripeptide--D-alanyl-D-alanine ligase